MSNFELMGKNLIDLRKRKGITQTQLANLVNETPYKPDIKQSRISDLERLNGVRDVGLTMLEHADVKIANAWLRQHFQVWAASNQVQRVEYL